MNAPLFISLIPVNAGRATRWQARCDDHGFVGQVVSSKTRAGQEAADHSKKDHLNKAIITAPIHAYTKKGR